MSYFNNLECFEEDEDISFLKIEDVLLFEKKYKFQLPDDYKDLMLRRNGGFLLRYGEDIKFFHFCLTIEECNRAPKIDKLFCLEDVASDSFDLAEEDLMPDYLLIIGEAEDTTSYLCLGISGENFGKVFIWPTSSHTDKWFDDEIDMAFEERGEVRDRSLKIADSIKELLDGLCTREKAKLWAPNEFPE